MQVTENLKRKIFDHLYLREGKRNVVYKDSLGKPTVGVGHLVLPQDNLKVGDKISDQKVDELLEYDAAWAIEAACEQAEEMGCTDDEVIVALTSVNFQLGKNWRREWVSTWGAIKSGDYQKAINNIAGSKWAKQTPVRTDDFITTLAKLRDGGASLGHTEQKENTMTEQNLEIKDNLKDGKTTTEYKGGVVGTIIALLVTVLNKYFEIGLEAQDIAVAISPIISYVLGRSYVKGKNIKG